MAKKKTQFGTSMMENDYQFIFYLRRLTELASTMFEWKNLPDTIDERFLELQLFYKGQVVFFEDEALGYLCLPVMGSGRWSIYNVPTQRRAYATNGYQKPLTEDDSVIIYNNYLRTNTEFDARLYASKLWDIDRTIQVNARAQKTPVLLKCDENQRLTLLNVYKEYDGNSPVIYGDKKLNTGDFTVLQTGAPYVADKLHNLKTAIWNEYLTHIGISNVNFEKKERLISDEVVRSSGGTAASRYSRLEMRRQACEKINQMFGLDISVEYREDFQQLVEPETTNDSEVQDNE